MRTNDEDKASMPSVDFMVDRLIDRAETENGFRCEKIKAVARRAKLATGTIQNFLRGRLKSVERIEGSIRAAYIQMLESELARVTHELEIARRVSDRMDSAAVFAADAAVQNARKMIEGLK